MSAPRKKKRAPAKSALRKLQLLGAYHATEFVANSLGKPFWFFEQRKARLQDRIANDRDDNR